MKRASSLATASTSASTVTTVSSSLPSQSLILTRLNELLAKPSAHVVQEALQKKGLKKAAAIDDEQEKHVKKEIERVAFQEHFHSIAEMLLQKTIMQVKNNNYRLLEVEFYLYDAVHPDIFSHRNEDQKTCGVWYFHKQGKSYKGGTYMGLDIAFGKNDDAFGGILIRAIKNLSTEEVIDGPCLVVQEILKKNDCKSILELVGKPSYSHSIYGGELLTIQPIEGEDEAPGKEAEPIRKKTKQYPIWRTPRVGLTLKQHPFDVRLDYVLRNYRFITQPHLISKGSMHVILGMHAVGISAQEIQKHTESRIATIQKLIDQYETSLKQAKAHLATEPNLDVLLKKYVKADFQGAKGTKDFCSLYALINLKNQITIILNAPN